MSHLPLATSSWGPSLYIWQQRCHWGGGMVCFWSLGEIFGDDDDHRGGCADGGGDCMVVIIVILMIIMVVMMMMMVMVMMMMMPWCRDAMMMMMMNGFKATPRWCIYIYIHSYDLVEVPPGPMSLDFIARIVCGISMNFPKLPPICLSIEDVWGMFPSSSKKPLATWNRYFPFLSHVSPPLVSICALLRWCLCWRLVSEEEGGGGAVEVAKFGHDLVCCSMMFYLHCLCLA